MIITQRDIHFFEYLHACKVATTKQINRDIFKTSHSTCYQRLQKYLDKKLVKVVPTDRSRDQSLAYGVTSRGEKIIKANLRDVLSGDRFNSNSVAHDLQLVDIRNALIGKSMVKEYFTENQIQTYRDFISEDKLKPLRELQVDAGFKIYKEGSPVLDIGLELEVSVKSIARYREKFQKFYNYSSVTALFYICEDKLLESKLKKIEQEFIKSKMPRIYYATLEEFFESKQDVTFTNQEGDFLKVH